MTEEKIDVIIQARMGSTRLPGKVLLPICGHPMLWHVVTRCRSIKSVSDVIVATSECAADQPIRDLCTKEGYSFFAGSEDDVLGRYFHAAHYYHSSIVIRITADCPLIDPDLVQEGIETFRRKRADYLYNNLVPVFPHGLDFEIFTFAALRRAHEECTEPYQREHVTLYLMNHPELFRTTSVESTENLHEMRVTVDESLDLSLVAEVMRRAGVAARFEDLRALWVADKSVFDQNRAAADRHRSRLESRSDEATRR